jgi:hypothetical protein
MARVITRVIRSERRRAASVEIEEEMKATWRRAIIPRIFGYFSNVVGEWTAENRPNLLSIFTDLPNGFEVWTGPVGPNAQIWDWITNGTKGPYKIPKQPKPPGSPLKFRTDYRPRTGLSGQYRGPGKAFGPWASAYQVQHPGIKPRNFEKLFIGYITPAFRKESRNAVRRGLRKHERNTRETTETL